MRFLGKYKLVIILAGAICVINITKKKVDTYIMGNTFSTDTLFASVGVATIMGGAAYILQSMTETGPASFEGLTLPFVYILPFVVGWSLMVAMGSDCTKIKEKPDEPVMKTLETTIKSTSVSDMLGPAIMLILTIIGIAMSFVPVPGIKTIIVGMLNNPFGYAFVVLLVTTICYTIMRGIKC